RRAAAKVTSSVGMAGGFWTRITSGLRRTTRNTQTRRSVCRTTRAAAAGSSNARGQARSRAGGSRWQVIRGWSRSSAWSALPAQATMSTSTSWAASASAWYCMRGLRPRSPRTTVVTRIRSRSHEEPNIPRPPFPTAASRRRLLVVVGPTAGHVYPALALAEAWRALDPGADVGFAGALEGPAERLLRAHGFRLLPVSGSQLVNIGVRGKLAAVPRGLVGMAQASRLLRAQGTRLVIGLGGYTSGAVLLAARALGAGV